MICPACVTGEHSSCSEMIEGRQDPISGYWEVTVCCCTRDQERVRV